MDKMDITTLRDARGTGSPISAGKWESRSSRMVYRPDLVRGKGPKRSGKPKDWHGPDKPYTTKKEATYKRLRALERNHPEKFERVTGERANKNRYPCLLCGEFAPKKIEFQDRSRQWRTVLYCGEHVADASDRMRKAGLRIRRIRSTIPRKSIQTVSGGLPSLGKNSR